MIYLSLDKVHEALDAYKKAHALEPNNENYKQSIKLCEDRLNGSGSSGTSASSVSSNMNIYLVYRIYLYIGSKFIINVWFIVRWCKWWT
jgi:tetratricopeptide (TPR) repeat protein